tara:strand:- start:929 stop:1930 length:1002 start_codon:yes stop_codon:yes gene_type:complete
MNILILGLGSIGQRHLRNIRKLYPKTKFYSYRRRFNTPSLDNLNNVKKFDLKSKYKITYIKNLNNLKKFEIDAALICTPSSFHIDEAIKIISQRINIFVEKPLGSTLKKIKKLEKLIKTKKVISMIGFQLRFSPILKQIKRILKNKKFGKLNQVLIHHGENINNFHKYEDYKNIYASKKKLGGGVILTQIHEIDYFLYLFSDYKIQKVTSISRKISSLKIDVEDTLCAIFKLKKLNNELICNLNLNYYEIPQKRTITLIYDNQKIKADLNKKTITYETNSKIRRIKYKYHRNDLFLDEIKFFISCVKKKKFIDKSLNLYNGIKTLKFAIDLKG